MSYLALYRKYRPNNFSDLVGQSEVVTIIKNEILNNKISHAYLFSGPRGTGKTSTAKIIAKMINCCNLSDDGNPCGKCESCINFDSSSDVVEIDAASNNGVDEIRDLRDKVNLVPTYGKYKVYIIDEVHMLTTQAFNALLKTLEEPPSHIVFILATTEFYKIPITVISRCQKFQFLKFSNEIIIDRLKYICKKEKIKADDDVLLEIARLSEGGMRDAINMLDQLSSFGNSKIFLDDVYKLNGVLSYNEFSDLYRYICLNDCNSIINFVESIDANGKNMNRFADDFLVFLKDLLIYKSSSLNSIETVEKKKLFDEISDLLDISQLYKMIISINDLVVRLHSSSFSKILLITEFIKLSFDFSVKESNSDFKENSNGSTDNNLTINANKSIKSKKKELKVNNKVTVFLEKDKSIRVNNSFALASKKDKEEFLKKWEMVVGNVLNNDEYSAMASMINDIDAMVVGGNYVIFVAKYDSLLDRLYDNINIVEKILLEVYNNSYRVVFLSDDEWSIEKEKYVNSLKSGNKYTLLDDISSSVDNENNSTEIKDDDVEKIVSILGDDVVSYE